jgi:fatty acid desaturase
MIELADPTVGPPCGGVPRVDEYAQLKRLITEQGLLDRQPRRYIVPAAALSLMLVVIAAGVILSSGSWWVLAWAAPAAFLFGQVGFVAHEAAHSQILRTSRGNYALSLVLFNLSLGGSRGWWANKHNIHHAQPNRIGTDPDIAGGVIATSESEAMRARGIARLVIRRQATAIWPLLCLGVLQIHIYSAGFLFNRRLRNAGCEAGLLLAHAVAYLGGLILLLGVCRGLLFALVHQMLLGAYLGAAFLPNHLGMPMLQPGEPMDFLGRQVRAARNLRANRVADYVFGALTCQIEHHLFPTMPRCNLRAAAPIVRRFCQERGIAYHETGVFDAYCEVHRYLASVVVPLRRQPASVCIEA